MSDMSHKRAKIAAMRREIDRFLRTGTGETRLAVSVERAYYAGVTRRTLDRHLSALSLISADFVR